MNLSLDVLVAVVGPPAARAASGAESRLVVIGDACAGRAAHARVGHGHDRQRARAAACTSRRLRRSRGCSDAERVCALPLPRRNVFTPPPTTAERAQILARRLARAPPGAWAADVDVDALARASAGFSGADLVALCQSAALRALRDADARADDAAGEAAEAGARAPHMTAAHFERALPGSS